MGFHSPSTQKYRELIYDTGASQQDNVFTSITDFFNAIDDMAQGERYLTLKQSVTAPSGAFDLTNCVLRGNSAAFDAGGVTLTVTTGTTFTFSGIAPKVTKGLRVRSTSSANIITSSEAATYNFEEVAAIQSTTACFIKNTGSVQVVLAVASSARFLDDGYENFETTAGAFGSNIVINYQQGIAFNNDTIRSTNAQVLIQVLDTVVMDASIFPTSHTNFSVAVAVNLNRSYSPNMNFVPTEKTASFTATKSNGWYRCNANSGAITATLPPAIGGGYRLGFIKTDSSINAVTVDGDGSETINGATTKVLSLQYDTVTVMDVASGVWEIVS